MTTWKNPQTWVCGFFMEEKNDTVSLHAGSRSEVTIKVFHKFH